MLKGKWEIAGSGKQLDNVLKETRVVSIMELELLVTGANFLNKKERTSSPAPNSKATKDGKG